jgi:hypothetical protein
MQHHNAAAELNDGHDLHQLVLLFLENPTRMLYVIIERKTTKTRTAIQRCILHQFITNTSNSGVGVISGLRAGLIWGSKQGRGETFFIFPRTSKLALVVTGAL